MHLLEAILNLLYPPRCCACQQHTERPDFCADCKARIRSPRSPLCPRCGIPFRTGSTDPQASVTLSDHPCERCLRRDQRFRKARACVIYDAASDSQHPFNAVLHRYKYARDVSLALPLGRLLAERAPLDLATCDVIVPVPLHIDRLRWRGFNQAQLLATPLACRAGVPIDAFALERVRATQPQVELNGVDRRRNVARAFRVPHPETVRRRRVLLVDDVYTTGATAQECARALMRGGAGSVDVLVLARAILH